MTAALFSVAVGALVAGSPSAQAADLVIGLKDSPLSVDPHFLVTAVTQKVNAQVFEPIIKKDLDNAVRPCLAESWEMTDDKTWVFKLRKDVKFSDGSSFTAEDVVFSYDRLRNGNIPGSTNSYVSYFKLIKEISVPDPYTIKIVTNDPAPGLLDNLSALLIVQKKSAQGFVNDDYVKGKAIGTGPYILQSWAMNDNTMLVKNPSYWGEKEPWDKVTYKIIPVDASRLASLISGDVDVIESVATDDIERLKKDPRIAIWERTTPKVAYLGLDYGDEMVKQGRITGPNGEKLDKNPLADRNVREALRISLDVEAFAKRIHADQVLPTGQYFQPTDPGYDPDVKPWRADVERARKLVADAGWANKFQLEITIAATLFQNAIASAEAVAQQWTRIGVPTKVANVPYQIYLAKRVAREVPVSLATFQNSTATPEYLYPNFLHSRDNEKGFGIFNYSRYANPELDKIIETAGVTMDANKRKEMYKQVIRIGVADSAVIPLWLHLETIASKKSIVVRPRSDGQLYPVNIRPAPVAAKQ